MKSVRARPHRLAPFVYQGQVSVSFTACLENRPAFFVHPDVVSVFSGCLQEACAKQLLRAVYCFMPDHVHVMTMGFEETSDGLRGMNFFKQRSGYCLKKHCADVRWQRSFYDEILRTDRSLAASIRYLVQNPVRRGLVTDWSEYPFTGAIGLNLQDLLSDISTVP
jgi:putative transposase